MTSDLNYMYAFDCSGDLKNKAKQFIASLMPKSLVDYLTCCLLLLFKCKEINSFFMSAQQQMQMFPKGLDGSRLDGIVIIDI